MTLLNIKTSLSSLLILIFFWNQLSLAEPQPSDTLLAAPELIKALQSGGHIIYMRHSSTDHTQKDLDRQKLDDCSQQRNLSEAGRNQAKKIGRAIRKLEIPVEEVISSPYCRCKDTARLVFEQFKIDPLLGFSISKNKEESILLGKHLYNVMLNSTIGNKNTVFVGHTSNLKDGLGIWPKPEGVVVVFQKHDTTLLYKGMILPDEWPEP